MLAPELGRPNLHFKANKSQPAVGPAVAVVIDTIHIVGVENPGIAGLLDHAQADISVVIPAINVDQITVEGVSVEDLRKGPGHYPSTPNPGQAGNSAIAGHRTTYGAPFHRVDELQPGDEIITSLEFPKDGRWQRIGKEISYRLREGAPFTFGRALGLGTEPIDHGTQLDIDGVAVFNRVLEPEELSALAFKKVTHAKRQGP